MRVLMLSLLGLVVSTTGGAATLPKLNLESTYTVSGISSGAYMASQYHLAHADEVNGVGLIAGGPYGCAEGSLGKALSRCVGKVDDSLNVEALLRQAKARSAAKQLASVANWASAKIWLFHGNVDKTVAREVTDAALAFYQGIVPTSNLRYVSDVAAAHGFPTLRTGAACDAATSPFLNACNYDAAGAMLQFLLGPLNPPRAESAGGVLVFDQAAYAPDGDLSLADKGYLYVPAGCAKGERCRLHIAFHGCQQNAETIGERFVREAGYNTWADANQLVILYPQTTASMLPLNPKACWDWWGYTDADYDTRKGNQIATVANMVAAMKH